MVYGCTCNCCLFWRVANTTRIKESLVNKSKNCQGENIINSYNTVLLSPKHVINLLQQVPVPQDKCGQQRIHEIHQRSGHLLTVQLPAAHVE